MTKKIIPPKKDSAARKAATKPAKTAAPAKSAKKTTAKPAVKAASAAVAAKGQAKPVRKGVPAKPAPKAAAVKPAPKPQPKPTAKKPAAKQAVKTAVKPPLKKTVVPASPKKPSPAKTAKRSKKTDDLAEDLDFGGIPDTVDPEIKALMDAEAKRACRKEIRYESSVFDGSVRRITIRRTTVSFDAKQDPAGKPAKGCRPVSKPEGEDLWSYMASVGLERKVIDIAIAQSQLPNDLRKDAEQEIRVTWASIRPDTVRFKQGQIASYAHRIAKHAVLRLRRDIGSAVRLPGSAFRKKKDGSTYVTPGILAGALDWHGMEDWLMMDDQSTAEHMGLTTQGDLYNQASADGEVAEMGYHDLLVERLKLVGAVNDRLSPRQKNIVAMLIAGTSIQDIQGSLGLKRGSFLREVRNLSQVLSGRHNGL